MAMSSDLTSSPNAPASRIPDPARRALREWDIIKDNVQVRPLRRNDLELLIQDVGKGNPRGIDLSGADMRGIDLRGLDLRNAVFEGSNLEGAIAVPMLTGQGGDSLPFQDMGYEAALNGWHTGETPRWIQSVQCTQLDGANLKTANLSRSDFRWSIMRAATLTRAIIRLSDMSYADLSDATMDWARMDDVTLRLANLAGASLKHARLLSVDFTYADLQDTNLVGIFISHRTQFKSVNWGKKCISILEKKGDYKEAIALYDKLTEWHEMAGLQDLAGTFYYRKRESQRKENQQSLVKDLIEFKQALQGIFKSKG